MSDIGNKSMDDIFKERKEAGLQAEIYYLEGIIRKLFEDRAEIIEHHEKEKAKLKNELLNERTKAEGISMSHNVIKNNIIGALEGFNINHSKDEILKGIRRAIIMAMASPKKK